MGEYSDWSGPADPSELGGNMSDWNPGSDDVAPAGSGGDPYGGGDWDMGGQDFTEASTTGVLPGGADGQYSPWSPNGGFDVSDAWRLAAGSGILPGLAQHAGLTIGGPNGINLGTSPQVLSRSQAGGAGVSASDIVRSVRQSTGLRVTAKSIVNLIVRYGFPAAARLTGLAAQQLLVLFMRQKGVVHRKRGPGLYTIARKLRQAERLQHTVSRILGRARHAAPARRARGGFRTMRRRSRRRR